MFKKETKEPRHTNVKEQIRAYITDSLNYYVKKQQQYLEILDSVPDDVTVTFTYGTLYIDTEDKKVFTKLGKTIGSEVKKYVNEYSRTGSLSLYKDGISIYSKTIDLPDTCQFKEVEETTTTKKLVPIGNCGSWFDKEPAKIQNGTEVA